MPGSASPGSCPLGWPAPRHSVAAAVAQTRAVPAAPQVAASKPWRQTPSLATMLANATIPPDCERRIGLAACQGLRSAQYASTVGSMAQLAQPESSSDAAVTPNGRCDCEAPAPQARGARHLRVAQLRACRSHSRKRFRPARLNRRCADHVVRLTSGSLRALLQGLKATPDPGAERLPP